MVWSSENLQQAISSLVVATLISTLEIEQVMRRQRNKQPYIPYEVLEEYDVSSCSGRDRWSSRVSRYVWVYTCAATSDLPARARMWKWNAKERMRCAAQSRALRHASAARRHPCALYTQSCLCRLISVRVSNSCPSGWCRWWSVHKLKSKGNEGRQKVSERPAMKTELFWMWMKKRWLKKERPGNDQYSVVIYLVGFNL